MGLDLATFFAVGVQNALTPMQLATAGVLVLALLFLARLPYPVLLRFAALFIVAAVISGVVFDTGLLLPVFMAPDFQMLTSWSYGCLGIVFLLLGGLWWREWRCFLAGQERPLGAFLRRFLVPEWLLPPAAILLGVWLSFLSNAWPESLPAVWQGAVAFTPGRLLFSVGSLLFYELCRNAAGLLVLLVLGLYGIRGGREFFGRWRSLISAVLSAFYLAAGGGLVHFYLAQLSKG